jgi:hypothetical protein
MKNPQKRISPQRHRGTEDSEGKRDRLAQMLKDAEESPEKRNICSSP